MTIPTNDDRLIWAEIAMDAYTQACPTDDEDALCDLLTDLMHWAGVYGKAFDKELERARMHYQAESL